MSPTSRSPASGHRSGLSIANGIVTSPENGSLPLGFTTVGGLTAYWNAAAPKGGVYKLRTAFSSGSIYQGAIGVRGSVQGTPEGFVYLPAAAAFSLAAIGFLQSIGAASTYDAGPILEQAYATSNNVAWVFVAANRSNANSGIGVSICGTAIPLQGTCLAWYSGFRWPQN